MASRSLTLGNRGLRCPTDSQSLECLETWFPSRPSSSIMSFTCQGAGEIRRPAFVHWKIRFSMVISLASVGLTPTICCRVSWRLRRDFRTASRSCEKDGVTVHDSHHLPAWRLEGTPRHLSHHHPSRFDSFLNFAVPRPCSLSRPVQAVPQSPTTSCPGVEVAVVRQLDEHPRERLCVQSMHA